MAMESHVSYVNQSKGIAALCFSQSKTPQSISVFPVKAMVSVTLGIKNARGSSMSLDGGMDFLSL